jgi:hypothetical protein
VTSIVRGVRERLVMRDAAQLDVVFRRDDDLGMGLESKSRIAAAKLGAPFGEDRFVADRARSVGWWRSTRTVAAATSRR